MCSYSWKKLFSDCQVKINSNIGNSAVALSLAAACCSPSCYPPMILGSCNQPPLLAVSTICCHQNKPQDCIVCALEHCHHFFYRALTFYKHCALGVFTLFRRSIFLRGRTVTFSPCLKSFCFPGCGSFGGLVLIIFREKLGIPPRLSGVAGVAVTYGDPSCVV